MVSVILKTEPLPNRVRIFNVLLAFPSHGSQEIFPDKMYLERKMFTKILFVENFSRLLLMPASNSTI